MRKIIGIYCIENLITGHRYIGQSRDINRRMRQHLCSLSKGEGNRRLQNAWQEFGKESFVFHILQECSQDELDDLEKFYIEQDNTTNRDFGYNVLHGGYIEIPTRFMGHTEEEKKKISQASINHWKSDEYRMKHTMYINNGGREAFRKRSKEFWDTRRDEIISIFNLPEVRKRKSDSAKKMWERDEYRENKLASLKSNYKADTRRKLTNIEDVLEIRRLYDTREMSQEKIAKKFGITRSGVQSIGLRRAWKWVDEA